MTTLAHHMPSMNPLSTAVVSIFWAANSSLRMRRCFMYLRSSQNCFICAPWSAPEWVADFALVCCLLFSCHVPHSAALAHCTLKSSTWTHARKFCKWDMDAWSEGLFLKGTNFTANKLMRNSCISQLPWCAQQWTRRPPLMLDAWWQWSGKDHLHGIQSYTESWRYFATSGMHCLSPVPLQRKEPKWM